MIKEELLSRFNILRTEYIKLLNDKDVLLQWGKPQLEALYATRVGTYQVKRLQLQLHIQALKRKLEIVRSAIARNLPLDVNAIEILIATELEEAELQIMLQLSQIEKGKELLTHLESPKRSAELRTIFRELAKQLHPDVNPMLTAEQTRVWHLAKAAYEAENRDQGLFEGLVPQIIVLFLIDRLLCRYLHFRKERFTISYCPHNQSCRAVAGNKASRIV